MAAVTSCEYTLYCQGGVDEKPLQVSIQMIDVEQYFWQGNSNQLGLFCPISSLDQLCS